MWKRFRRWLRSFLGGAIESLEDPEKILRQNLRELREQVPKMNEGIAMMVANATIIQSRLDARREKIEQLKSRIKASLQVGRRDMALGYATTLEQENGDCASDEAQLRVALEAKDRAMRVKDVFMAEMSRRIEKVQQALALHKQNQWQARVAGAMEQFQVGGIDATHDEMIERIDREAALSQAKMEMALDNIDIQGLEIEKEAQKIQANELLKQFEVELGLVSPTTVASATEKTVGPIAGEETLAEIEKTVGPKTPVVT
ncbi:MAG: PspA/IM30 family protein [Patescibacteria group bacterium]|jgi:phage shock protein A